MIEFRNFKKGYTATIYLQTLFLFLEMHEIGKVGNKNEPFAIPISNLSLFYAIKLLLRNGLFEIARLPNFRP